MNSENIKVITAWDDNKDIKLVYKSQGVRKVKTIHDFDWYFCFKSSDLDKVSRDILINFQRLGQFNRLQKSGEYVKVYCDLPRACEDLKKYFRSEGITLYESDLSKFKRYLIDTQCEIETNLDVLYFDIETDDSVGGIEIGRDRILSWSGVDAAGNVYFESGEEADLLLKFVQTLENYDVFTGWNSGGFDFPYIQARMAIYGLKYDWRKKIHVDLMARCVKLYSYDMDKVGLVGFSLEEFSSTYLKESKIKFTGKIHELYKNDFEKFKEYNINDSKLLVKLDKKLGIIDLMVRECQVTGTLLNKFYVGELLDNYILRESKKKNIFMPSRPTLEETGVWDTIDIIGGYVHEPKTGMYDDVRIFDFKSLYPSIIVGWNIGQDSLDTVLSQKGDAAFQVFLNSRKIEAVSFEEWRDFLLTQKKELDPDNAYYQTANNNYFYRHVSSFISDLINNLLIVRQDYKKQTKIHPVGSSEYANAWGMQAVVKELANSIFGITGDKSSRYFNKNIAEGITLSGQFLNKASSHILAQNGYPVIYGDTDSIFAAISNSESMHDIEKKVNSDLHKFLTDNFNLAAYIIELEYDKHYKRMLMIDKKKYTGLVVYMSGQETSVIFSRGTEDVKKSTIKFTRKNIMTLIQMMTVNSCTKQQAIEWLEKLKEIVMQSTELDIKDFAINMKVSKPTTAYKTMPLHVRLARKLIQDGKLLEAVESKRTWGNRISYVVTKSEGGLDGVLLDEFAGEWDRPYYWNIHVFSPMERLLKTAWPEENWGRYAVPKQSKVNINQLSLFS